MDTIITWILNLLFLLAFFSCKSRCNNPPCYSYPKPLYANTRVLPSFKDPLDLLLFPRDPPLEVVPHMPHVWVPFLQLIHRILNFPADSSHVHDDAARPCHLCRRRHFLANISVPPNPCARPCRLCPRRHFLANISVPPNPLPYRSRLPPRVGGDREPNPMTLSNRHLGQRRPLRLALDSESLVVAFSLHPGFRRISLSNTTLLVLYHLLPLLATNLSPLRHSLPLPAFLPPPSAH